MSPSVVSVNAGVVKPVEWDAGSLPVTAIEKHPVEGPVRITSNGVEGNEWADVENHGDEWMKVYAYSVEDYDYWVDQLSAPIRHGQFGEQLTTAGIDLNAALVGEVWRVGTALLKVAHVRIPCQTFKGWMGTSGYDDTTWVKRFTLAGRPGPYFAVLEEGYVEAGADITVVERPDHDVSVQDLFLALTIAPDRLPRLVDVPGLKPWVSERARSAAAGL